MFLTFHVVNPDSGRFCDVISGIVAAPSLSCSAPCLSHLTSCYLRRIFPHFPPVSLHKRRDEGSPLETCGCSVNVCGNGLLERDKCFPSAALCSNNTAVLLSDLLWLKEGGGLMAPLPPPPCMEQREEKGGETAPP